MMRGINTTVRRLRRKVFEEVAALGFKANADTLCDDMEAIPYALVNDETEQYRDSVYRARAVVREQVRLAMGLALRPEDKPVHLTAGVEASNISDKYYEPPLIQVIPSACMRCEAKGYEVSNMCKGCLAHPCMEVCPKKAISLDRVTGKSIIDQDACIKCGRCATVCSYNAIIVQERPCAKACGMKAITSDENGKATIDYDKCVSCGMCLVNCPFGAISDKSQIYQVIKAIQSGEKVYAAVAPAFVGQFGPKVTPEKLRAAMKELGFADVLEVAIGADLCAKQEAEENLALFESLIGDGYLYTQETGTILMSRAEEGETLAGGDIVFAYSNPEKITVSVAVSQDSIAQLSVGESAMVMISDYGNYNGVIESIDPVSSSDSRTSVTYTVEVALDGDVSDLSANLTATVIFGMDADNVQNDEAQQPRTEMEEEAQTQTEENTQQGGSRNE